MTSLRKCDWRAVAAGSEHRAIKPSATADWTEDAEVAGSISVSLLGGRRERRGELMQKRE